MLQLSRFVSKIYDCYQYYFYSMIFNSNLAGLSNLSYNLLIFLFPEHNNRFVGQELAR